MDEIMYDELLGLDLPDDQASSALSSSGTFTVFGFTYAWWAWVLILLAVVVILALLFKTFKR